MLLMKGATEPDILARFAQTNWVLTKVKFTLDQINDSLNHINIILRL